MATKKRIQPVFNPGEYDYLNDKIPLLGWIWEFERRSEAYCRAFNELKKGEEPKEGDELFFISQDIDPSCNWTEVKKMQPSHICKSVPVKVFNLNWQYPMKEVKKSSSEIEKKYEHDAVVKKVFRDRGKKYHMGHHAAVKKVYKDNVVIFSHYREHGMHPLNELVKEMGKENVVMALVDLSAPNSAIFEALGSEFDKWRKSVSIKKKTSPTIAKNLNERKKLLKSSAVWAECLAIYDFIRSNQDSFVKGDIVSFRKVSQALMLSIPEKTVENRYKTAYRMIEGGEYKTLY